MELVRVLCIVLVLASLGCAPEVEGYAIPAKYDGFAYPPRPGKAPLMLEAFVDPMCPDCRTAWPTMKALVDIYGAALSLYLHTFPLPFHHNSFFAARSLHIAHSLNESYMVPLLELIYRDQELFGNDATAKETPDNVVNRFGSLAVETGISSRLFSSGFSDSATDQATRSSFKYGCSRYVTSTPSYLVNGVPIAADETWSVKQWRSVLDPLLPTDDNEASGDAFEDRLSAC